MPYLPKNEAAIRWLLVMEGLAILLTITAFWHHSPPIRDQWIWLLWLPVIFFWLRLRITGRLWTHTPLHDWLVLFVLLAAFNFTHAPYARQDFAVLLSRPLLGIWIYIYCIEYARTFRNTHGLVAAVIGIALLIALLALTATGWQTDQKASQLQGVIDLLPRFDYREAADQTSAEFCTALLQPIIRTPCVRVSDLLDNSLLSFNPNEIAGALAWLAPLMAAIALANPHPDGTVDRRWQALRIGAGVTAVLLLIALILGQSRFAIGGVLLALAMVGYWMVRNPLIRRAALVGLVLLVLLQAFFLLSGTPADSGSPAEADTAGLSERDQRTFSNRFDLWERGFRMMLDYPLTGAGMSMYRSAVGSERYSIPYYVELGTNPPHAHNEWAQIAADLGVPGLALFLVWQFVVLRMIWQGWKQHHPYGQIIAGAAFAGLLAHAAYGIGDAITLWDRFAFLLWCLVGLAGAQWILIQPEHAAETAES